MNKKKVRSSDKHQRQFQKKVMILVWWNFEDITHIEIVLIDRAEIYDEKFERFNKLLTQKYPTFVSPENNYIT